MHNQLSSKWFFFFEKPVLPRLPTTVSNNNCFTSHLHIIDIIVSYLYFGLDADQTSHWQVHKDLVHTGYLYEWYLFGNKYMNIHSQNRNADATALFRVKRHLTVLDIIWSYQLVLVSLRSKKKTHQRLKKTKYRDSAVCPQPPPPLPHTPNAFSPSVDPKPRFLRHHNIELE